MTQKTKFQEFFNHFADDEEPNFCQCMAAWNAALDAAIQRLKETEAKDIRGTIEELKEK